MLRWIVILVVALIALANAPQPSAKPGRSQPKAEQSKPSPPAPPPPPKTVERVEPPEYYRPCEQNGQDRNSDLCAQWTAAKGATEAAYWAKWSFWIGLLGLGGLIATLHYTRKAVLAAEEATKDADRAIEIAARNADAAAALAETSRDALHNDLRAWIGISCTVSGCKPYQGGVIMSVDVILRNYGKSPAPEPLVSLIGFTRTNFAGEGKRKNRDFGSQPFEPVMPGKTSKEGFSLHFDKQQIDEIKAIAAEEGAHFVLLGFRAICTYRPVFATMADPPRISKVTHTVSGKMSDDEETLLDQGEWFENVCKADDLNVWPGFSGFNRLT